jgi:hypothetical protein
MSNRGKGQALRSGWDRKHPAVFPFCFLLLLLLPSHSAQAPKIQRRPTTGPEMLAEAKRLAFLHNWPKAAPLFTQAEQFFAGRGDRLQEIYAHVGRRTMRTVRERETNSPILLAGRPSSPRKLTCSRSFRTSTINSSRAPAAARPLSAGL